MATELDRALAIVAGESPELFAHESLDRALAFIAKTGCARTDLIAKHLACDGEHVDKIVAPAVAVGYLVACKVMRPGKPDAYDYRVSEACSVTKALSFADFSITHKPKVAAGSSFVMAAPPPRTPVNQDFRARTPEKSAVKETAMSQQITRNDVLQRIKSAGKFGTTRAQLIEHFGGSTSAVDQHLFQLRKIKPPVIHSPERGLIVAVEFIAAQPVATIAISSAGKERLANHELVMAYLQAQEPGTAAVPSAIAQVIDCTVLSTANVLLGLYTGMKCDREKIGNDFAYFVSPPPQTSVNNGGNITRIDTGEQQHDSNTGETSAGIPSGASDWSMDEPGQEVTPGGESLPLDLDKEQADDVAQFIADVSAAAASTAPANMAHPHAAVVAEDGFAEIVLNDADMVDFAIWSNGAMTIDDGAATIQLSSAVAKKLVAYLGCFQESPSC